MSKPRTSIVLYVIALALAFPVWSAGQGATANDPHTRFTGTYHHVGSSDRANLDAAIERTIADMSFVARPIARGRLRDKNPIFSSVSFTCTGGNIEVSFGGPSITYRSPETGTLGTGLGVGGDTVHIEQRFDNGNVSEVIHADQGERRNYFMLSGDGQGLTVRVTMTSSRLPTPLRYDLNYHK